MRYLNLFNYLQAFPNISIAGPLILPSRINPNTDLISVSLLTPCLTIYIFHFQGFLTQTFLFLVLSLFKDIFIWRQSSPYLYLFYLSLFLLQSFPLSSLSCSFLSSLLFVSPHFVIFFLFLFNNFSCVVLVSTPPLPSILFFSPQRLYLLLSLYFLSLSKSSSLFCLSPLYLSFSLSPFLPSYLTFSSLLSFSLSLPPSPLSYQLVCLTAT